MGAEWERKCAILMGEMEEIRGSLEVSERVRKQAESELHEAADRLSEVGAVNLALVTSRRKMELDAVALVADLEEAVVEVKVGEERVRKATDDANRLSEELRNEQV